jgi:hypothetical protein
VTTSALQSYRHYKGGTYTLLYVARNSEQRDQELAVYVSHERQQVWVRPWSMFNELVQWPDGVQRPRFTPLQDVLLDKFDALLDELGTDDITSEDVAVVQAEW